MINANPSHPTKPDNEPSGSSGQTLFTPINILEVIPELVNMPWVFANEVRRILTAPFIWVGFLLHGVKLQKGWRIFGMPIIQKYRGSTIEIGEQVEMRSWVSSNPLAPYHPVVLATRTASARIKLGYSVGLASARVISASSIEIGNRVMVGANATIIDTDFHPLDPMERQINIRGGKTAPIIIEDDVFIGMNSLILKGVRIGKGSVIGAGSVVTRDVPAGSIAAGNPARMIGKNIP